MVLQALVGEFATQMHTLHPGADGGGDRTADQQSSLDTARSARRDDFDALMKLQSIIGAPSNQRVSSLRTFPKSLSGLTDPRSGDPQ